MKKLFLFLFAFCNALSYSQNFSITINQPSCFQTCDGSIVFLDTVGVNGPFTAVVTNTGSCPNSTTQVSTATSLTVSNLCACSSVYTISVYNSLSALVSYEFFQLPITSTAALVVNTPTILPATCPSCCNGSVYVTWSGGYAPPPNDPVLTLDGDTINNAYFPNDSVCVGSHTICATDLANCKTCVTFSMHFVGNVSVNENLFQNSFYISPNPVLNNLFIRSSNSSFNKLVIYDIGGKVIFEAENNHQVVYKTMNVDLSALKPGVYFLEIINTEQKTKSHQKIIKLEN